MDVKTIVHTKWTDLGLGPLRIQTMSGPILIFVANSLPAATFMSGFTISTRSEYNDPFGDASSHVYGRATIPNPTDVVTLRSDVSTPSVISSLSADQDPILDHAAGTKVSITTSAILITPPTGCKYIRISSDVDIFINTNDAVAADNEFNIRIIANSPEIIPVTAGVALRGLSSSGTAIVRCTPYKNR